MSIQDRKLRQQLEVRQHILDSAKMIATEEGWSGVTMRKIADQIEYSLPVIYRHFTNKEAILSEIAREGFQELQLVMQEAQQAGANFRDSALKMAVAYVQFAIQKPYMYQAMFLLEGVTDYDGQTLKNSEEMFDFIQAILVDLQTNHNAQIENIHDTTELLWSTFHGLASLTIIHRISRAKVRYVELAETAIENYFKIWKI